MEVAVVQERALQLVLHDPRTAGPHDRHVRLRADAAGELQELHLLRGLEHAALRQHRVQPLRVHSQSLGELPRARRVQVGRRRKLAAVGVLPLQKEQLPRARQRLPQIADVPHLIHAVLLAEAL